MTYSREFIAGCNELGIFKPTETIPADLTAVPDLNPENLIAFLNQTRNPVSAEIDERRISGLSPLDSLQRAALKGVRFGEFPKGTDFVGCCALTEENFEYSLQNADNPAALLDRVAIVIRKEDNPMAFIKSHGDPSAYMIADDPSKGLVAGAFGVLEEIAYVKRGDTDSTKSPLCVTIPYSAVDKFHPIRMGAMPLPSEVRNSLLHEDPTANYLKLSPQDIVTRTMEIMKAATTRDLSHDEAKKFLVAGKIVTI